jgi:hypothetical protein
MIGSVLYGSVPARVANYTNVGVQSCWYSCKNKVVQQCGGRGQSVSRRPSDVRKTTASLVLSVTPVGKRCANIRLVVRFLLVAMCLIPGAAPLSGVTMQQLSMGDLAVKSTAIVRGHVLDSYSALAGPTVYTHYHVAVTETWKGTPGSTIDVALPGGVASGIRQSFPGVPQLSIGNDYILYLWTAPSSGIIMPTGFSQGIFTVTGDVTTELMISRSASAELMLDSSGHPVRDKAVSMRFADMKSGVAAGLSKSTGTKSGSGK